MPSPSASACPVLLAGPTACGKSALALALARGTNACIINADALQVYGCWNILTARPGPDEQAVCPHVLYGHVGIDEPYSVGKWMREVAEVLEDCAARGVRPIVVGGTGLYFGALTEGLAEIPEIPAGVREAGNRIRSETPRKFARELRERDPATAASIDLRNTARAQRAWEVLTATGIGLRAWQDRPYRPLLPLGDADAFVMEGPAAWLRERIERRFAAMLRDGALDECRAVLDAGYDPDLPSCRALGARELMSFIAGELSREAAVERAVIRTRQYAKRQRTWFRNRMRGWTRIPAHERVTVEDLDLRPSRT